NADIFAEILESAGLPIPPGIQGQPFDKVDHQIFSEVYRVPAEAKKWPDRYNHDLKAVFPGSPGSLKLILSSRDDYQLFNLAVDPRETTRLIDPWKYNDIKAAFEIFLESLQPLIEKFKQRKTKTTKKLDKETLKRLRTLGYVD
ncbi:MAG: hypothetical protein GY940_03160, partial [bacterium]|nr:hypothetical protein [bacterium]